MLTIVLQTSELMRMSLSDHKSALSIFTPSRTSKWKYSSWNNYMNMTEISRVFFVLHMFLPSGVVMFRSCKGAGRRFWICSHTCSYFLLGSLFPSVGLAVRRADKLDTYRYVLHSPPQLSSLPGCTLLNLIPRSVSKAEHYFLLYQQNAAVQSLLCMYPGLRPPSVTSRLCLLAVHVPCPLVWLSASPGPRSGAGATWTENSQRCCMEQFVCGCLEECGKAQAWSRSVAWCEVVGRNPVFSKTFACSRNCCCSLPPAHKFTAVQSVLSWCVISVGNAGLIINPRTLSCQQELSLFCLMFAAMLVLLSCESLEPALSACSHPEKGIQMYGFFLFFF